RNHYPSDLTADCSRGSPVTAGASGANEYTPRRDRKICRGGSSIGFHQVVDRACQAHRSGRRFRQEEVGQGASKRIIAQEKLFLEFERTTPFLMFRPTGLTLRAARFQRNGDIS